jgi:5-(aminomethyl)-3-furanmethanol phosphate kinase
MTTVLKIGGGLPRDRGDEALRSLCAAVGEAAARHPLLVVPGGGAFADAVREEDRRFALRAETTHAMAVLAMDQFGLMLGDLVPRAGVCRDLDTAAGLVRDGRPAVLLPAALVLAAPDLPASWDVTSDSIAAWVSGRAGARRVVLLKAVPGLYAGRPGKGEPIRALTASRLAALQRESGAAGVDPFLAAALTAAGVEAWVIAGDDPRRLVELLDSGATTGTCVTPERAASRLRGVAPLLK